MIDLPFADLNIISIYKLTIINLPFAVLWWVHTKIQVDRIQWVLGDVAKYEILELLAM